MTVGHALQDISEPGKGLDVVELCGGDEGADGCPPDAAAVRAREQMVFQIAAAAQSNKCVKNGRLQFLGCNSLIPFKNSLILKIFSLIICLGNCSRSGCSAAVSWH
jgi:hypothetical protein